MKKEIQVVKQSSNKSAHVEKSLQEEVRVHVTKITQMETTITNIKQERDEMRSKMESSAKQISEMQAQMNRLIHFK